MRSFAQFLSEAATTTLCIIKVEVGGIDPESDDKTPVAFRGANILQVAKAIAGKVDSLFGHDKKRAKSAMIEPLSISITSGQTKYQHSVQSGHNFGNGSELIVALVHEYSQILPKTNHEHMLALEMWGNAYEEEFDDREDEYYSTDKAIAAKKTIFAKSFAELADKSATALRHEFDKGHHQLTLNFAGIPENAIEEGIYKAIIATKSTAFYF